MGEIEKNKGEAGRFTGSNIVLPLVDVPPTYAEQGISKMDASRWQAIASFPEELFEEYIENLKDVSP